MPKKWVKRDYSKDVPGGAVKNPTRKNPAVRFLATDRQYQNESGYSVRRGGKQPDEDVNETRRRPKTSSGAEGFITGALRKMRSGRK